MPDIKKYYYLKLKENFFEDDRILVIETMPNGYKYINILLKLYLRSLKNEGKLMFNEKIPYTTKILAQVTRHSEVDVTNAIKVFQDLELIETLSNGAIYILDIQNFIGKSSTEADRIRNYRSKIESEKSGINESIAGKNDVVVQKLYKSTPEIELEREIEIKKPYVEFDNSTIEFELSNLLYQSILSNSRKMKKPNMQSWCKHIDYMIRIDKHDPQEIRKVIEFVSKDSFWWSNILSTKKLREKYVTLYAKMQSNGGKNNGKPKSIKPNDKFGGFI